MKTALLQLDINWEDRPGNLRKIVPLIQQASADGCDVAVLPEMFTSGCTLNAEALDESEHGETFHALSGLAQRNNLNLIAGYGSKSSRSGRPQNAGVVFDRQGNLRARYVKMHPFSPAGEDAVFEPGDAPVTFALDGVAAGLFICYDLRFPEVFREVARRVSAIFVIANWPAGRSGHWDVLLRARAIENQCFIVAVNCRGTDGYGTAYDGGSAIIDPQGNIVCSGGSEEECVIGSFNPDDAADARSAFPALADMKRYCS